MAAFSKAKNEVGIWMEQLIWPLVNANDGENTTDGTSCSFASLLRKKNPEFSLLGTFLERAASLPIALAHLLPYV